MAEKPNNKRRMNLMLLQESIWKVEDKLRVILESLADHEAELIRTRNSMNELLRKLDLLERHMEGKGTKEGKK
jgi:hypothetical protein